jgi:hypothetical protein
MSAQKPTKKQQWWRERFQVEGRIAQLAGSIRELQDCHSPYISRIEKDQLSSALFMLTSILIHIKEGRYETWRKHSE